MKCVVFVVTALILISAIIYQKVFVMDETPLALIAEWFDDDATINRSFTLLYWPKSNKIQLYEPRTQKMFLKKSLIEGLRSQDIFLGNTILILSRLFTIRDYADDYTKKILSGKTERTFAMIKPDAVKHMGAVLQYIQENGLQLRAATMARLTEMHATEFYKEHTGKPFLPGLIKYVTSGPVLAMQLQGENAVPLWRKMIGPTDPVQAIADNPSSLRARFGTDKTFNGFHGSDSTEAAMRESLLFFPSNPKDKDMAPQSSATLINCTCCIIKPHAIADGNLGSILMAIQEEGFNISGFELIRFDRASAAEFHEVYDGVLFEYMDMVTQLQSGPSVVLEITRSKDALTDATINEQSSDEDTVQAFRDLVGPHDAELAKQIRPKSLRARFGKSKILNAIHCTDLSGDGALEVEYAFKILRGTF